MPADTPNVGLKRPDSGSFVDTWDQPVNDNADTLDALFTTGPRLKDAHHSTNVPLLSAAENIFTGIQRVASLHAKGEPWFDVKAYGAKGDAKMVIDAVTNAGGNLKRITSVTANFTSADVGKKCWASINNAASVPYTTITSLISATEIEVADNATTGGSGRKLVWGTDDTQAFVDANTAVRSSISAGPGAAVAAKGATLYMPAGGYIVSTGEVIDQTETGDSGSGHGGGYHVLGAGSQATLLFAAPTITVSQSNSGLFNKAGNTSRAIVGGFTVHGADTAYNPGFSATAAWKFGYSTALVYDVQAWGWGGLNPGAGGSALRFQSFTGAAYKINSGETGNGVDCYLIDSGVGPADYFHIQTNNGKWRIANITTTPIENAHGINFWGGMFDEASANVQLTIENSKFIRFFGTRHFPGVTDSITVDGTSEVFFNGCRIRKFGDQGTGNMDGIDIASGGKVSLSDTLVKGYGTGFAVRNAGTVFDLGGNTYDGTGIGGAGVFEARTAVFTKPLRKNIPVIATADLPAAAAAMDSTLVIEDNGTGDRNLVFYVGTQRFRIDGGAAF